MRHAAGREANIPPELRLYPVTIISEPAGASIAIETTSAGRTPSTVKLQPNTYRVKLTMSGYKAWSQTVTVGQVPLEVKAKLEQE